MSKKILFFLIALIGINANGQEMGIHRSFFHYGGEEGSGYNAVGLYFGKSFVVKGKESKNQFIIKPQVYAGSWYESKSNSEDWLIYTLAEPRFTLGASASFMYARKGEKNIFMIGFSAGYFEVPGVFGPSLGYYRKLNDKWAIGINLVSSAAPGSYSTSFGSYTLGLTKNLF